MPITLTCPLCKTSMMVPMYTHGMQVRCPGCKNVVVPAAPAASGAPVVFSLDDAPAPVPSARPRPMPPAPLPVDDDLPLAAPSKTPLIVAGALAVVVAVGGVGYWLATRDKPAEPEGASATTTTPTPKKGAETGALPADESKDLEALDTLIQVVRSGEQADRLAAARRLGALGPKATSAIPALLAAADGKSAALETAIGAALDKIGPPPTVGGPLLKALGSKSAVAKGYAVHTLVTATSVPGEAIPPLIDVLADASPKVRAGAAKALGVAGAKAKTALPQLLDLASDMDDDVRAAVAATLPKLGPFEADDKAAIEKRLAHAEARVRLAAAGLLAPLVTAEDVLKTWQPLVKDADPEVRSFALGQIAKQPESLEKCGEAVVLLFADTSPASRLAAVTVAAKMKGVPGVEAGVEKLLAAETDDEVKAAAMVAAVALADPARERLDLFRKALTAGPPAARKVAAEKLAALKTDAAPAVDDLTKCVADADDESRAAAIRALAAAGPDGVRGRDAVAKAFAAEKAAEPVLVAAAEYLAAVEGGAKVLKDARNRPLPGPAVAALCRAFAKSPDKDTLKWMTARAADVADCREAVTAALVKNAENEHVVDLIELTYATRAGKPGQKETRAPIDSRRWALGVLSKINVTDRATAATRQRLADRVRDLSMAVRPEEKELAMEAAAFLKVLRP